MAISRQQKNVHLLWRTGFGPSVTELDKVINTEPDQLFRQIFSKSKRSPEYLRLANNAFDGLVKGLQNLGKMEELSKEDKQKMRKQSREAIKSLNLEWIDEMVHTQAQLREKMALFWHNHFACRNLNMLYQQQLLDVIRRNALGNFSELLLEVSRSAAMLAFLNNQQNRKQKPNENFAREVMELFTLGRGNYSEEDVKEAARAFTGWGFNLPGDFVFRKQFHDEGTKTVLGKRGTLGGEDVLNILLDRRETALFIARKMYRHFVNEEPDEKKVAWLGQRFYDSNYEIGQLVQDIFLSEWFYHPSNMGNKIKSPIELWVGIRRMLPMELQTPEAQLLIQRVLGQVLFYPPNVAGWPGGKAWIDSSSLMVRMRLPRLLTDMDTWDMESKSDDDVQMGMEQKENKQAKGMINADIRWELLYERHKQVERKDLADRLLESLVHAQPDRSNLLKHTDASSREAFIRSFTINTMSLPEYQLC